MKTNELKKGDRVLLDCGWFATIWDNMKGDTRMAEVEGDFTEIGSVYSHDIVSYIDETGTNLAIEHTPNQLKLKAKVEASYGN